MLPDIWRAKNKQLRNRSSGKTCVAVTYAPCAERLSPIDRSIPPQTVPSGEIRDAGKFELPIEVKRDSDS